MYNATSEQRFHQVISEWLRMSGTRKTEDNILIVNYDYFEYNQKLSYQLDDKSWRSRGLEITGGDGCDTIILGRMSRMCESCKIKINLGKGNDFNL